MATSTSLLRAAAPERLLRRPHGAVDSSAVGPTRHVGSLGKLPRRISVSFGPYGESDLNPPSGSPAGVFVLLSCCAARWADPSTFTSLSGTLITPFDTSKTLACPTRSRTYERWPDQQSPSTMDLVRRRPVGRGPQPRPFVDDRITFAPYPSSGEAACRLSGADPTDSSMERRRGCLPPPTLQEYPHANSWEKYRQNPVCGP